MNLKLNSCFPTILDCLKTSLAAFALTTIFFSIPATAAPVPQQQEKSDAKQDEESDELVTVRGQFELDTEMVKDFDWDSMTAQLIEVVVLRQAPLPDDWENMSREKRNEWALAFQASDDGKKLVEANQKILAERTVLEITIREGGRFIVYDVPRGRYDLRAVAQKEIDERTYVLQCYGQIPVGDVEEIDLSKMPVDILRLLKMDEPAPEISGTTVDGAEIKLSHLRGQHVLMAFGLTSNPAFQITTRALAEAAGSVESAGKLQVLTVTVDEEIAEVKKFNEENQVAWHCLNLGKWDQKTLNEYGLKMVPSLWLIDPDGKIVLTGQQFIFELNRTGFNVAKLVDEAIAGRLVIGGEAVEDPGNVP